MTVKLAAVSAGATVADIEGAGRVRVAMEVVTMAVAVLVPVAFWRR